MDLRILAHKVISRLSFRAVRKYQYIQAVLSVLS